MKKKLLKEKIKSIKECRNYNNATYLCHTCDVVDDRECYMGKKARTCKTCNMLRQVKILQNCVRNWE